MKTQLIFTESNILPLILPDGKVSFPKISPVKIVDFTLRMSILPKLDLCRAIGYL